MAEPKVRINEPTYSVKEALEITGLTHTALYAAVDEATKDSTLRWPQMAKLVVAVKMLDTLPLSLRNRMTWLNIADIVMRGPVPRAGRCTIRPDGVVYYVAAGMYSSKVDGLSMVWDGQLKVD